MHHLHRAGEQPSPGSIPASPPAALAAPLQDDEMYVGSFGKEFTDPKGIRPPGFGNMWVKVIDKELRVRHEVSAARSG